MTATSTTRIDQGSQVDVLALIDHFVLGGAETLLTRFALSAPEAGIRVHVACLRDLMGNPAAAPLVAAGQPPVNLTLNGRTGPGALRAVRAHMARLRPDIVHTHLGTSDLLGAMSARSLGIPVVSTIHTMQFTTWRDRVTRRVVRALDARVISVSESAREQYLASGWASPEQVVTIHNGMDVAAAPGAGTAVRAELGLAPDDQVAVMVSALRAEKAHDVAVEAVRRLRPRFPHLRLLIVGQGTMRAQIEAQAADLGDAVLFAGLRPDVMRVLDAADVCLHPSHREAFPTTLIEAMAAHVPVIATATGGIPEIITGPELGRLIPAPPEPGALADALAELLASPERRAAIGEAGRAAYEARHTAGPWIHRTRALYDEVIAQAGRRSPAATSVTAEHVGAL